MFFQLVLKEMKYQSRNITFYLFIAVVLMFYITQFLPYIDQIDVSGPKPGMQSYGRKEVTDKETEIKVVYLDMYTYYNAGTISKQSLLVNKIVKLSDKQKAEVKAAMDKLARLKDDRGNISLENIEVKASYDEYLKVVRDLDKYLGGSTYYGDKYRKYILQQPMTYEDAKREFEDIKKNDKITNAYGRVFADYMGITAGLFPVFLSAFMLTRDKRSRMREIIYCRSISSFRYIAAKYLGILICLMVIYLAIAGHATFSTIALVQSAGYAVDVFAFFRYTITWIVPTLMFSTAAGMFISLLFGNGVAAIFVQFVLWLVSITSLGGNYELFRNVIRFNTLGSYEKYMSWLPQITANRIFYTVLSIAIIWVTAWVFSLKRGAANGLKTYEANVVQYKDIT